MPSILGRSGMQYVANGSKTFKLVLCSTFTALVESNNSGTNWLRYQSFFIIFDQNLVEYMTSSLG